MSSIVWRSHYKGMVIHLFALCLGLWLLIPLIWGGVAGLAGGMMIERSPDYQQRVESYYQMHGIPQNATIAQLDVRDRKELRLLAVPLLQNNAVWFPLALGVATLGFGLLGYIGGRISGNIYMSALLPVLATVFPPLYLSGWVGASFSCWEKVLIVATQYVVSLSFSLFGKIVKESRRMQEEGGSGTLGRDPAVS